MSWFSRRRVRRSLRLIVWYTLHPTTAPPSTPHGRVARDETRP